MDENNNQIENERDKHLLDLPDHCLLCVFEFCDLKELFRLSKLNHRFFRLIASHCLSTREIRFKEISKNISVHSFAKRFLPFAKRVTISIDDVQFRHEKHTDSDAIVDLLVTHANKNKIQELKITANFDQIELKNLDRLAELIVNVKCLTLENRITFWRLQQDWTPMINKIMSHAKQIQHIRLENFVLIGRLFDIPEHEFDQLKNLEISNCSALEATTTLCIATIGAHLKEFLLECRILHNNSRNFDYIKNTCSALASFAPQLEALTLSYVDHQTHTTDSYDHGHIFDDLLQLSHLKRFGLNMGTFCKHTNVFEFISKLKQVKDLTLKDMCNKYMCPTASVYGSREIKCALGHLNQLQRLTWNRIFPLQVADYTWIAETFTSLEVLEIVDSRSMLVKSFIELVAMPNLKELLLGAARVNFTTSLFSRMVCALRRKRNIKFKLELRKSMYKAVCQLWKHKNVEIVLLVPIEDNKNDRN